MLLVLRAALGAAPSPTTAAAPEPIELRWDAPASCPDAEAVRGHARRRAGPRGGVPVRAHGTVDAIDEVTWRLELVIGSDRREIRASSCEALAEAAGLLIAVAADPALSADPPEPPAAEVPPPPPEPPAIVAPTPAPAIEPVAVTEPVTPTAPRAPPRIGAAVRAEVTGQFLRVLPAPAAVAFGGAVALRLPRARLELRGRYFLAQRARYDEAGVDAGGTIDLWTLGTSACYAPRRGRLEVPICAGIELGAMVGRSFGATMPGSARALFAALPVDATVIWAPIPRVGLALGLGATPAVRRPSFHLRDRDPVFVAGPFGLRVLGGVEVRFP